MNYGAGALARDILLQLSAALPKHWQPGRCVHIAINIKASAADARRLSLPVRRFDVGAVTCPTRPP